MFVPLAALHAAAHAFYLAQGLRSRALRAGERRLHLYDKRGSGKGPPALLVHGLGGNAYSFAPLVAPLSRLCRRVVLLDLPGHGRSRLGPGQAPAGMLEHAQAAGAALLDLGEPALLVGNSLGGAICLHLAIAAPAQVAGVVGLAPAGAPLTAEDRDALLRAFVGGVREMSRRLYFRPPRSMWLFSRDLERLWGAPTVQGLLAELDAAEAGIPPELLGKLARPALILWGEADLLLPQTSIDYFRAHLRGAVVEVVPQCGHLPQLERPRLVARRLARFVAELPGSDVFPATAAQQRRQ